MKAPEIRDSEDFISIREAATIIGCSPQRVYQFVRDGRISAQKVGRTLILPVQEVRQFKRIPAGRQRTKPPLWSANQSGSTFLATVIKVQIRPGMREQLQAKLTKLAARSRQKHNFRGSVARFVTADAETMTMTLLWKKSELPNDMTRQQDLRAFQKDFQELDWNTAQYSLEDAFLHT